MPYYSSAHSRGLPARTTEGPKYYYHAGPPHDPYQRAYYHPIAVPTSPSSQKGQIHYRVVHYAPPAHVGTPVSNTKTVRFDCRQYEGGERKVSATSGYRVVKI
jgi:hypothetical protein